MNVIRDKTQSLWNFYSRSALFWDITRRRVVTVHRRFGTTYRSHLHGSRVRVLFTVKMVQIRCPETSVNNYHTTPRNIPEERRYHQHRGGNLKSRNLDSLPIRGKASDLLWDPPSLLF
jgi:hypothetical protein